MQRRILQMPSVNPFLFHTTEAANAFLLSEGTDVRYAARPLKRAIRAAIGLPFIETDSDRTDQYRRRD